MKRYQSFLIYVHRDGRTAPSNISNTRNLATITTNWVLRDIIRDKRKLLLEVSPRGDVYLTFKKNHIKLTKEQVQQICGLWKNLRRT